MLRVRSWWRWSRRRFRLNAFTLTGTVILIGLVLLTRSRNEVWRQETTLWQDAVNKSPMKPRPRMNLAWAYQQAGQYKEALREYRSALQLANSPEVEAREKGITRVLAATNAVKLLMDLGRFDEAAELAIPAWNNSGYPGLAVNLSSLLLRDSQPDLAIKIIDTATTAGIEAYPWFPKMDLGSLYWNRGEAFRLKGDCKTSLWSYSKAIQLNPGLPPGECP